MLLKVIAVIGLTLLILVPALCVSECEKAAYAGLTHEQKTSICSEGEGIGPALCSVAAKGLHLSTKEIVNLCKGAIGTSPVECLRAIPSRFRKMYGDQLCPSHASTTAPGKCFATITGFKGAHTHPSPKGSAASDGENNDVRQLDRERKHHRASA